MGTFVHIENKKKKRRQGQGEELNTNNAAHKDEWNDFTYAKPFRCVFVLCVCALKFISFVSTVLFRFQKIKSRLKHQNSQGVFFFFKYNFGQCKRTY